MLTTADIKKLLEVFATKEDLKRLKEGLVSKEEFETTMSKVMEKLDSAY